MPSNFHLEHLVKLHMKGSKLEKLWEGVKLLTNLMWMHLESSENLKEIPDLSKATSLTELILSGCKNLKQIPDLSEFTSLKKLILSGCKNLKEIPDLSKAINLVHLDLSECENLKEFSNLSKATNLEILVLDDCTSLVKLPSSIQHLDKLRTLNMRRCTSLEDLPTNINLESLTYLDLSGCSRLRTFPQLSTSIKQLELSETAIKAVPPWIEDIDGLTGLWMSGCTSLEDLPTNINLESLTYLDLSGCSRLRTFPQLSTSIKQLELSETAIKAVPPWIEDIDGLTALWMSGCTSLEDLPTNINLESLTYLNFSGCSRLRTFPQLSTSIKQLELSETAIKAVPPWIEDIDGLTGLWMSGCTSLEDLPTNINLESLTILNFSGCSRLRTFPQLSTSIKQLELSETAIKAVPPWIENIDGLTKLWMRRCTSLEDLPTNINLESLTTLIFGGCSRLRTFPQLSTSIKQLELSETAIKAVPPWIEDIDGLTRLWMSGCTSLEDLPTNINLESLTFLDLSGCSRLRTFPQLSTSIKQLYLSKTAIEEVPSWIENFIWLTHLEMRGCEKLKEISANIWNLKHLECVDFTDCRGVTSVSDTSLVKTVAELHEKMYLSCSDSGTEFLFYNCFNLDQDAQKFILHSDFKYATLPGKKVPTYFTHRAPGSSLTVPLPQSSLSQNHLRFTAYIIPNPNLAATGFQNSYEKIIVHWKFRGVEGAHEFSLAMDSAEMDHLGVFHFNIFSQEDPPSRLDCENVEFEFKYHLNWTSDLGFETSSLLPIKECGVRGLDVFPSLDASDRSSEAEYTDQYKESDEESGKSKKRMRDDSGASSSTFQPTRRQNCSELGVDGSMC